MLGHATWLCWCTVLQVSKVLSFEVFSEQQTLTLNDPTLLVNYNNTEYGSTHVDDYWTKLDIAYSPLEGWKLFRHVRIGCFIVAFGSAPLEAYVERIDREFNEIECVNFCNLTQAYYQYPACRCGLNEDDLFMTEVVGNTCPPQAWEVFREYDYRSSMSPAAYDVVRRLVYQIVTMRVPHVNPSVQYFIHAVNAMEAKPKFEYDTRLERMVFNAVWDFGKSRMVALSFEDWGAPLDFTLVQFNTSTGSLRVRQAHYPLSRQISADGSLVSSGLASADGMGTVDILYGTYYTVVPAVLSTSPQVVHVIVAIDIETKQVILSRTLPVTLMNLQINSLQHTLYGAGADLSGRYGYYELCRAENVTRNATDDVGIEVTCPFNELSALPAVVNHMYLQSATIDHHFNFAWMTYKQQATGRPLILEYHQDSADYVLWREDSLPLEAAFSSLIQTAPRIIFSLYPPTIKYAKFSTSGTKIFIEFDAPTLRGAIPIDADGDELPDYWNNEDKVTRAPCADFWDDFTMELIPDSMCQWTSDSSMFMELNMLATIMPGDLVRIRGNRIFAGKKTPSGVYLFSQPSTDFAIVEVPDFIPYPIVRIGGNLLIDTCTELVLDGSESKDHGFRGTFLWTLNRTEPPKPEPHVREIDKVLADLQEGPVSPRIITFPPDILEGATKYYITLTVFSFFDVNKHSSLTHGVRVSSVPIPPLVIFGASYQTVLATESISLVALVYLEGCLNASSASTVTYSWTGCLSSQAENVFEGILGCPQWADSIPLDQVSGNEGRSLYIQPLTLNPLQEYMFSVRATVATTSDGVLQNVASVTVLVELSGLVLRAHGGNGFSAAQDEHVVVDLSSSLDPSDPANLLGVPPAFNFSCQVLATGAPCFAFRSPAPSPTPSPFPVLSGDGSSAESFRRLTEDTFLERVPCAPVPYNFTFRGQEYRHAEAVTYGDLSQEQQYCMQGEAVLIIQKESLELGQHRFEVNMSKIIQGELRTQQATVIVTILEPNTGRDGDASPQVIIRVESEMPYVVSETLRLVGEVTNRRNTTAYTYSWSGEIYAVNPDYDVDRAITDPTYDVPVYRYVALDSAALDPSDPAFVKTPVGSRFFVIPPYVLSPGIKYRLRLDVSDSVLSFRETPDAVGFAELRFTAFGLPPSGGRLEASALTGSAFDTTFTISMVGWGTDDLPKLYQFGYVRDFEDPYADMTYFYSQYVTRSFIETILPPGAVMPAYRLRVTGYIRSSYGAVSNASLELSVPPPTGRAARQRVIRMISEFDAETALLKATMIVQDAVPNSLELAQVLNATLAAGVMNSTYIPNTPTTLTRIAHFLAELCAKGLRSQLLLDTVTTLFDHGLASGFVRGDALLSPGPGDVVRPLLVASDCLLPGEPPPPARRRLAGARALQAAPAVDTRPPDVRHSHLLEVRAVERRLGTELLLQIFPGEVPLGYTLRGHDLYLGKDFTHTEGLLRQHSVIQGSFAIPSLDAPGLPEIYTYRYMQYKKYPYGFMPLPDKRTLFVPSDSAGITERRIPLQGYGENETLWHAMSLEITNETGGNAADMVSQSLENATFSILPKIAAHPLYSFATYEHAATCYAVTVGENLTEANYDARDVVYSEDSCVTKHLSDFVVLIDDLARELELMEESAGDFLGSYLDGYRSMAMVGMIVFTLIIALAAAACAFYVDAIEPDDKDAIDDIKNRVIEKPDPKEKLIETLLFTFKRDHLLVGMGQKHRKLTRDKRVQTVLLAWLATEAVATVMNTRLRFKAERHFVAIGLVAGVLVFPLTQFVQFLFDWCPQTRGKLPFVPLGSTPAKPIPLKQQANVPHLHKPKKPAVPQQIVPPPPGAPLRSTGLSPPVLPPGLPLELPALKQGDRSKKIAPPPRQERQAPRPPKEPPPAHHLMAARSIGGPLGLEALRPALAAQATRGAAAGGPFGLTLPELPPLPIGTHRLEGGQVPAPPPKRPGAGPKPPQAPPPLTKMFFAVPQGAALRVPPVPPLKAAPTAGGPKLPPLPKLTRPHEAIRLVKAGGRDPASQALPPPPPPKEALRHFPAPPMTPRDDDDGWVDGAATPKAARSPVALALPGALVPTELTAGAAPRTDAEAAPLPRPKLAREPEHTMMRPLRSDAPPPPPPPLPAQGLPAQLPRLPELPAAPALRQLAAPDGAPPAPPKPAWPPGAAGAQLPPLGPPPGTLAPLALPPLQIAPGQRRMPALPKHLPLQLPSTAFMKVPAIQQHADGLLPPPPPPPPALALPGWDKPMPPEEGEPPAGAQQLMPYKPPSLSGRPLPRPPPKLPQQALLPTPPVGPPPAHAIILARKTGNSGIDEQALAKKVKPPPMVPRLPDEAVPSFVRRNPPPEAQEVVAQKVVQGQAGRLGRDKPLKVVPDWVVQASFWAVEIFVGGCIVGSCFFIVYWGVYLESRAQWATHAATVVGCIMNMGVFESLKCVVIACVNLMRSEKAKRQEELHARKARMALKAQRLQERAGQQRRARQMQERNLKQGRAPPLLVQGVPRQTLQQGHSAS